MRIASQVRAQCVNATGAAIRWIAAPVLLNRAPSRARAMAENSN
jgi:hypothetical protein